MEPRKAVLNQSPQQGEEATKSRFQIIKLEERVAPRQGGCYYCYPNQGWSKHGWTGPPGQVR